MICIDTVVLSQTIVTLWHWDEFHLYLALLWHCGLGWVKTDMIYWSQKLWWGPPKRSFAWQALKPLVTREKKGPNKGVLHAKYYSRPRTNEHWSQILQMGPEKGVLHARPGRSKQVLTSNLIPCFHHHQCHQRLVAVIIITISWPFLLNFVQQQNKKRHLRQLSKCRQCELHAQAHHHHHHHHQVKIKSV